MTSLRMKHWCGILWELHLHGCAKNPRLVHHLWLEGIIDDREYQWLKKQDKLPDRIHGLLLDRAYQTDWTLHTGPNKDPKRLPPHKRNEEWLAKRQAAGRAP